MIARGMPIALIGLEAFLRRTRAVRLGLAFMRRRTVGIRWRGGISLARQGRACLICRADASGGPLSVEGLLERLKYIA